MSIFGNVVSKWMGSQPAPRNEFRRKGTPEPGDVVFLRLPTGDSPNRPGAHARYGVVVRSQTQPGSGELTLLVVPADFNGGKPGRACEFQVGPKAAAAAGLPKQANFDLRRAIASGWNAKWSEPGRYPIVGRLDDPSFERLRLGYRAWLEMKKETAARTQPAVPAQQPAPFNLEIAKLKRNRGQVIEQWG